MSAVKVERLGRIARVTLNRPEVKNAFNDEIVLELEEAFRNLAGEAHVVVLAGAGDAFCAGADLNWMKKSVDYSTEDNERDAAKMVGLFKSIDEFPGAVVGRIHGATLGGGLGLLSCCDVSIAVPNIKLAFSEVRLGLVPAIISPFVMNKISAADARVLFMTGQGFSSQKAQSMGLITEVVEPSELDATVEKYVRRFLVAGPKAMVEAKRLVKEVTLREREDALSFAVSKIAELRSSDEGQEGLAAFLEKRKPSWLS